MRSLLAGLPIASVAEAIDGIDPVVFAWQFRCRFFAELFVLAVSRALLGVGMGAEWVTGTTLVAETWPARTRGLAIGLLQGSWGIGFLLSSAAYGMLFNTIGWRGLLWMGILPAFAAAFVRWSGHSATGEMRRKQSFAGPQWNHEVRQEGSSAPDWWACRRAHVNSSSSAFAPLRSGVSNPSVNQP